MNLIEEAVIGQHFICPVEYGDVTGLTDHEEAQLNQWLGSYPGATFMWGEEDEFARCEVTGMMGKCVEVKIYEST
jgi:hypothetical protein